MSLVVMSIIFGWAAAIAMFAFCALNESGKLIKIRKRLALWLEPSATPVVRIPEETLQPQQEERA